MYQISCSAKKNFRSAAQATISARYAPLIRMMQRPTQAIVVTHVVPIKNPYLKEG